MSCFLVLRDFVVQRRCPYSARATETEFFERADLTDTKIGQSKKDDPTDVARQGFDAMMRGVGDVVTGWKNKLQPAIANVTPAGVLAEMHRKQTEPGSAPSKTPLSVGRSSDRE